MDPKAELLVFNKKEIFVILLLLVLVALFSFTLGLKMGKSLGSATKAPQADHAPLAEKHEPEAPPHADAQDAHSEPAPAEAAKLPAHDAKQLAEDQADAEFAAESDKEKVGIGKAVPMTLPKAKKSETAKGALRYTLQVGSHRTVAEASEQVSALKKKGLDAFYIEANVPGKGTWYRVGIGIFNTKEDAERGATEWKSKNLPAFIVQKIGE